MGDSIFIRPGVVDAVDKHGRPMEVPDVDCPEPMRRKPDVLPLGVLALALCFVAGFAIGSVAMLWWLA